VTISAVDGSDRVDIGRGDAPTYSPDGTQIVFARYRNGQSDIMVMNADGSNVVDLTKTTDVSEFLPDWSPDGSTIVFQRSMGNHEIFTMKPDGSSEYRITKNTVYDAYPSFSPDGTSLLMIHNDRIYTMDASGGSAFTVIGDPTDMGTYSTDWQPLPCTMTGTSGDDELIGTTGDDVICGDDGSDIIDGLGGNDTLLAGAGNDTLYGREGSDILAGGEGTDLLIGGDGKDRLAGDLEKDVMRAGAGDDYLFAWDRAGGDRLVCGTGTDRWAAESTDTVRC
jgi:Ca2+-binding RTX toxin-like protein